MDFYEIRLVCISTWTMGPMNLGSQKLSFPKPVPSAGDIRPSTGLDHLRPVEHLDTVDIRYHRNICEHIGFTDQPRTGML